MQNSNWSWLGLSLYWLNWSFYFSASSNAASLIKDAVSFWLCGAMCGAVSLHFDVFYVGFASAALQRDSLTPWAPAQEEKCYLTLDLHVLSEEKAPRLPWPCILIDGVGFVAILIYDWPQLISSGYNRTKGIRSDVMCERWDHYLTDPSLFWWANLL